MNWITFVMGAAALAPFWQRQVMYGIRNEHYKPLNGVAEKLRAMGRRMELAMYEATGGVNTHKGLIFALSLLLGAWGVCVSGGVSAREDVFAAAGRIISPRMEEELGEIIRKGGRGESLTHGESIYFTHGIGGIRTEAARGFPSVKRALEAFEEALGAGASYGNAALRALLLLMSRCEDTNVMHRGGVDFWRGEYAEWVLEAEGKFDPLEPGDYESVRELDRLLVVRGVSPGGAADMLACTLFMYRSKISGNMI
jgi:triphosphoribosyl-dephospho-CoA synthetase